MKRIIGLFSATLGFILVSSSAFAIADQITLIPEIKGAARDNGPQDSYFDEIREPPNDSQLYNNGYSEARFVFEFNMTTVPSDAEITSAELRTCISVPKDSNLPADDPQSRIIEIHRYGGDGALELIDFEQDGLINTEILQPTGSHLVTTDVTNHLQEDIGGYAGYNLREIYTAGNANYLIMKVSGCATTNPLELVINYASGPVDPPEAVKELVAIVVGLNIQSGVSNSLDSKLESALKAIDDLNANNDVAAINSLYAFIKAVEAQRGKAITDDDADELIAMALAIIESIENN